MSRAFKSRFTVCAFTYAKDKAERVMCKITHRQYGKPHTPKCSIMLESTDNLSRHSHLSVGIFEWRWVVMSSMTKRMIRFVDEYMVDLNSTQAAIRAGYSPASARNIGCENLRRPEIAKEIEARLSSLSDASTIRIEWVIDKLKNIVVMSMQEVPVFRQDLRTHKMVSTGIYRFDSIAAVRALELLGKYKGMFNRRDEIPPQGIIHVRFINGDDTTEADIPPK
jgi:phage terminase small subunit